MLQDEIRIEWEEDVRTMRYVREVVVRHCPHRQGPIVAPSSGRRVGYSVLAPDAPNDPSGGYTRRLFYVLEHDPYEGIGAPMEAVDPTTVAPGKRRERDARSLGSTCDLKQT